MPTSLVIASVIGRWKGNKVNPPSSTSVLFSDFRFSSLLAQRNQSASCRRSSLIPPSSRIPRPLPPKRVAYPPSPTLERTWFARPGRDTPLTPGPFFNPQVATEGKIPRTGFRSQLCVRSRNVGHSWSSIPPTRIAVSFSIGRSRGSPSEGAGYIRLGTAPQSPHPRIWDWQGSRISWLFPVETTGYSKLLLRLLQPFLIPGLRYSPRDLGRSVWHGVGFLY